MNTTTLNYDKKTVTRFGFIGIAALLLSFLMVGLLTSTSYASGPLPMDRGSDNSGGGFSGGNITVPPVNVEVVAGAVFTTGLATTVGQVGAMEGSRKAENRPPGKITEKFFSGGGSGVWTCPGNMPMDWQSSGGTERCPTTRKATVTFAEGSSSDQWVGVHIGSAKAQCGYGRDGKNSTVIGATISYQIVRVGTWRWDHNSMRAYLNPSIESNRLLKVNCIKLGFTDKNEVCTTSGMAVINMNVPKKKQVGNPQVGSTPWGNSATYENCQKSKSVGIALNRQLTEMGRYTLNATVYAQPIVVRHYAPHPLTGVQLKPEIIRIGKSYPAATGRSYAQVTCKPGYSGAGTSKSAIWRGSGWTWTATDCLNSDENTTPGGGNYQCRASDGVSLDQPKVNGTHTKQANLFRDNEKNTVAWSNPRPQGGYLLSSTPKRTKVERTGTPWNSPKSFAASNNNFRLETPNGTNRLTSNNGTKWLSGGVFSFNARANWASEAGKPTKLATTWEYDVRMRFPTVTITSLYVNTTGTNVRVAVAASQSTATVNTTARCYGYANLNFVRAVND